MSIKCKRRQTGQVVFLINIVVGCLYEVNVFFLALVVDVLQLVQDLLGLLVALSICDTEIEILLVELRTFVQSYRRTRQRDRFQPKSYPAS